MTPQIQNSAAQAAKQEIDAIMEEAQAFASAWSLIGGRFDDGNMAENAQQSKQRLFDMVSALRAPVVDEPPGGTRWPVLRAMARNYAAGNHTWDALDANACEQAAEEIRHLRAALASAPVANDVTPAGMKEICPECGHQFGCFHSQYIDKLRAQASATVAGEVVTDEMVQAGAKAAREYFERTGGNDPAVIYKAMRAAAPAAHQASAGAFAKLQSAYVGACDQIGELLAERQASANAAGEALVWRVSWPGGRRPTDWRDFATNPPPSAEYLARAGYTLQVAYAAPQAARAKASPEDLP